MEKRVFFLGMGMGKAGSTWIYQYLTSLEGVKAGPLKEMRVLSRPASGSWIRALMELPWYKFEGRQWIHEHFTRLPYRVNREKYYDVFSKLLTGDTRVTGEVSPGNIRISAEALREVRNSFAERGVHVVPILILRDPVDSLISSGFYKKTVLRKSRYRRDDRSATEIMVSKARDVTGQHDEAYLRAIPRLSEVFSPNETFITLFEDLFTEKEVRRLCKLLSINFRSEDFSIKVNASDRTSIDIPQEFFEPPIFDRISSWYAAASMQMGPDRILQRWPHAQKFTQ